MGMGRQGEGWMKKLLLFTLVAATLLSGTVSAAANVQTSPPDIIYPDGHFEYVTNIQNAQQLSSLITDTIEAQKTLFVRWIASPAWGWWRKQAPGWNAVTAAFAAAGNTDVIFADVNLRDTPSSPELRGSPYNAGVGGWPSLRHFNAATGPDGMAYAKETTLPMCQETKDVDRLTAYVERVANTKLVVAAEQQQEEL